MKLLSAKKRKIFVTFHSSVRWIKLAQPAEPTFLIPTLLMGALRAAPTHTAKQGFFFANMLLVKLSISILKNQNKTINLTICKTEYRGNILFESNLV